jgi:hypothetical protein
MTEAETNTPNTPMACKLTKRPLGKILVDGDFISRENLKSALEEQNNTSELLGEVLVRMGLIDPTDLKVVLSVQGNLASAEDAVKAAAGIRQLMGNLLRQARRISCEQLDFALTEQQKTGEQLGKVLLRLGLLTEKELDTVLAFQHNQGADRPVPVPFRLGEILIASNYITREQLEDALDRQKLSQKKLGEVLVEAGYVELRHVDHGLRLQKMLMTAALVAALSLSAVPDVHPSSAGSASSSSAKITVTATVLARASLKILHQTPELVVTNADISRGYVEVSAASKIEISNNSPAGYLLAFEGLAAPFNEVYVQGLGSEVQISSGTGLVRQQYTKGTVTAALSYRFVLAENAEPGTYAWPLAISAQPL